MSIPARSIRRTIPLALATLTVLFLAPPAAVAHPHELDQNACSQLLARAAIWPGGFVDEFGRPHRLVSDAYVSYLSAQPPCASPGD
jgi:hypothetical protein